VKIKVLCVGNIKNDEYYRLGSEYIKRLGRYLPISIHEIRAEKIQKNAKKIEAERIISFLKGKDCFTIAMCEEGKNLSSNEFSRLLKEKTFDTKEICFIIGGTDGLDDNIKKSSNLRLSLSKMTFTREMAWFILLEQIYRAVKIMHGEPYHR